MMKQEYVTGDIMELQNIKTFYIGNRSARMSLAMRDAAINIAESLGKKEYKVVDYGAMSRLPEFNHPTLIHTNKILSKPIPKDRKILFADDYGKLLGNKV